MHKKLKYRKSRFILIPLRMFNNKFDAVCNYSKKRKGVVRRIVFKLAKRRNNVQWAEGKKMERDLAI